MEDKKTLYIIIAVIVVLIIILSATIVWLFFYLKASPPPTAEELPATTNANQPGTLPGLPGNNTSTDQSADAQKDQLAKEKEFISSFWQTPEIQYAAAPTAYSLPLERIKEQVVNYRDFSRKVNLEPILDNLAKNGFTVVANPFDPKVANWGNGYQLIKENNLPILITSDSIIGIYQDTLQVIYKEIEQDIFYPSLWELLKEMFDQVKQRYEARRQQFGIETDIVTEANRLELAYLTVALNLLKPEQNQVKDPLVTDPKFFSAQEADTYKISTPPYLKDEVDKEINLIDTKAKEAKSPIFLYQKSYQNYDTPPQYKTSEKLKNYYLTITWLNDILFPLWNKENDCPDCLFDRQDQEINFLAALYLSNDLAGNQNLKNRWANIYKPISFFKGLEANLTYLDYHQALKDVFDEDYNLNEIFSSDLETTKDNIAKLQQEIDSYAFPKALSGEKEFKEKIGLRLLRNHYLLEDKLFDSLTGLDLGKYTGPVERGKPLPFTACPKDKDYYRCLPTALDLFNVLGAGQAKTILKDTANDAYENYQQSLNDFTAKLNDFDQYTWHDNAYLSLLSALQKLTLENRSSLPAFMQNDAWAKNELNTNLAAWVNFHREINFEKTAFEEGGGLLAYFPYGYIEPRLELYGQLLANTKMITNGFTTLQIISSREKSFERLKNLEAALEKIIGIAKKELENSTLDAQDYNFINNFTRQISNVTGDIKKENIQNRYTLVAETIGENFIKEQVNGFNYLIAIYPDAEGRLFFAIGPVLSYQETNNQGKTLTAWQKDFKP